MPLSSQLAKKHLSALQEEILERGPTDAVESSWLELRERLTEGDLFEVPQIASAWNHVGYLLFDQRGLFGVALHYRLEAMRCEASTGEPTVDDLFGVLVYASMAPEGLPIFVETFDRVLRHGPLIGRTRAQRIREVASELMESLESEALRQIVAARIARLSG
jgi:hypothetical protein